MNPAESDLSSVSDSGDTTSSGSAQGGWGELQSPTHEDTPSAQDSSGAAVSEGKAVVRKKDGVKLRLSLEKIDWFGERRTMVTTKVINQTNAERTVSYSYKHRITDGKRGGETWVR